MLGLRINAAEGSDKGGREVNHEKTRSTEIIELQTREPPASPSGDAIHDHRRRTLGSAFTSRSLQTSKLSEFTCGKVYFGSLGLLNSIEVLIRFKMN